MKTCSVGAGEEGKIRNFKFTEEATKEKKKKITTTTRFEVAAGILSSIHPNDPYLPVSLSDFLFSFLSPASTVCCALSLYSAIHLQRFKYSMLFSVTYES